MSRTIGGRLNLDALALLAGRDRHRPHDRQTLRAAAVELRQRGLTYRDVGQALGMSESAVSALLGPSL